MKPAHERLVDALLDRGIEHFCGVPDSVLAPFAAALAARVAAGRHVVCPNEGLAVAHAMGVQLATGSPAVIYLQNSGLGNAVNPIVSFASHRVARLPFVLVIGWRGEPGRPDEPQHGHQGATLDGLLELLDLPWRRLAAGAIEADAAWAVGTARERGGAALVVSRGFFESLPAVSGAAVGLTRRTVIDAILDAAPPGAGFVATTGFASRTFDEALAQRGLDSGRALLVVGAMGHAAQIGRTLSSLQPGRWIVGIDGDGAAQMHLGAFAMTRQTRPGRWVHVLLNNGCHESVGGQAVTDPTLDYCALARICGYECCAAVSDAGDLRGRLAAAFGARTPTFLAVTTVPDDGARLGRPRHTPEKNAAAFAQFLRSPAP